MSAEGRVDLGGGLLLGCECKTCNEIRNRRSVAASPVIADQPAPIANEQPAIWDLVIADMRTRDAVGRERYGTPLQAGNGRDALVDAYQEALDLAAYLRQAIEERATKVPT
jgi:hypothetical protein